MKTFVGILVDGLDALLEAFGVYDEEKDSEE